MFISVLELFKPGIGPSSSHTMGPMLAASRFIAEVEVPASAQRVRCVLKGSLALTGHGHASDRAVILGLHGHTPEQMALKDVEAELAALRGQHTLQMGERALQFDPTEDVVFDMQDTLPEHPNGMVFELLDAQGEVLLARRYFSIGGGFIHDQDEMANLVAPLTMVSDSSYPFPFDGATSMMQMAGDSGLSIAQMKRQNEYVKRSEAELNEGLQHIWQAMKACVERGLQTRGELPGGLKVQRRAACLYQQLQEQPEQAQLHEWLCAYAMAVNEENAAGHAVVTAPTNGAAGVIPAVLYYAWKHQSLSSEQIEDFLLTAGAVGGIIKHKSSISGAEVGCQGEVGSASAMAAAGLCAVLGGNAEQIEHAAEIALEHHLGMTCDPVKGLVQVPCIERNGFGALKAYTAASLALRNRSQHIMSLDNCIAAMKQTGLEMSHKFKETSLGGLAVNYTEC
ncbi:L-serine ammonia-lyase [Bacterioplanes sanyensis]|uniref:L-serine ammonia-lyase n=1 Tax=Bacterioplanes sanyensis TaxID=1249553 RepID=UPI00167B1B92|nr:L-serine ammonia-lyase [Bacterioplanes sanyensis]GGY57586.1 L-serine ammonia-lyase [Bacterioplanes sanyensis]